MRTLLVATFLFQVFSIVAQTTPAIETDKFYKALNQGDSAIVGSYLKDESIIKHVDFDTSYSFNKTGFMDVCPKFKSKLFQEEYEVVSESFGKGNVVIVQVDFKFFYDGVLDHCGTDYFIWISNCCDLYIDQVYSTSYKCEEEEDKNTENWITEDLNKKLDKWHEDAGKSNFDGYFELMADEFYFLGTAPGERWVKKEFAEFSKPYFDKKKGWKFKSVDRNWYFNRDFTVAWFEEDLDTRFEGCRGTGVFRRNAFYEWKIYHYNLTVLIENEKMDDFIKLRKK